MDKTFKFTRARIEKLEAPESSGRIYYKDRDYPKLLLQVTRSGAKSFYFRYWDPVARYTSKVHIGKFPDFLPDDARRRAVEMAHELAGGIDPANKNRRARAEVTFQAAFDSCMERPHSKRERRNSTVAIYHDIFRRHLSPTIARKNLNSITPDQIEALHRGMGTQNGRSVANHTIKVISLVFNDARKKGWQGQNPCSGIVLYPEQRRERFLEVDELGPFIRACEAELARSRSVIPATLLVALFTGVRRRNVCSLRWEQLNLDRRTWDIPKEEWKNNKAHRVYLSDYVTKVLSQLHEGKKSDLWVFPSSRQTGHVVEPKRALERVVARAGIDARGLVFHCLRHTFITYADDFGMPTAVRKRLAGHSCKGDVTDGYTHALDHRIRNSYENVARHMLNISRCGYGYGEQRMPPTDDVGTERSIVTSCDLVDVGGRATRRHSGLSTEVSNDSAI